MNLRERCENIVKENCWCPSPETCPCTEIKISILEEFVQQIRNEAIEDAKTIIRGWHIKKGGYTELAEVINGLKAAVPHKTHAQAAKEQSDG